MKILIATGLYPPDIGGPATYSKLLEEELPHQEIGVEVLSFGEVRSLPKIVRHFVYFLKLLKRGKDVHIIFAQDPVSVGLPAFCATFLLRKKFLLKIVGDYAWEQYCQASTISHRSSAIGQQTFVSVEEFQDARYDFVTETRRWIERFVSKMADKIIVPSMYLKKIIKKWGVKEEKIEVVYNAFEPVLITESRDELREKFKFQGPILVSAGRLVPWKGFRALIELMPEIVKEIPDGKLYIIGEGPEQAHLQRTTDNLQLGETVIFTGALEHGELLRYLKAADLFVLNTGYEGFSHLLLEVMSVGTPIITTDIGGNPELIENKKTGILIRYNDKGELKNSILLFLKTLEYQDLAKRAGERVKEFSKERLLKNTVFLLKQV